MATRSPLRTDPGHPGCARRSGDVAAQPGTGAAAAERLRGHAAIGCDRRPRTGGGGRRIARLPHDAGADRARCRAGPRARAPAARPDRRRAQSTLARPAGHRSLAHAGPVRTRGQDARRVRAARERARRAARFPGRLRFGRTSRGSDAARAARTARSGAVHRRGRRAALARAGRATQRSRSPRALPRAADARGQQDPAARVRDRRCTRHRRGVRRPCWPR